MQKNVVSLERNCRLKLIAVICWRSTLRHVWVSKRAHIFAAHKENQSVKKEAKVTE